MSDEYLSQPLDIGGGGNLVYACCLWYRKNPKRNHNLNRYSPNSPELQESYFAATVEHHSVFSLFEL